MTERPPKGKVGGQASPAQAFIRAMSSSHGAALESLGMRQSPRGERAAEVSLGPLGMAERLNWLVTKKRFANTSSHLTMVGRS